MTADGPMIYCVEAGAWEGDPCPNCGETLHRERQESGPVVWCLGCEFTCADEEQPGPGEEDAA